MTKSCQGVIFIVDDNPANLKVLDQFLKKSGYKVLIARDGESGLLKIVNVLPDLILLDILMPGLDGFETCRRLKSQELTRDIPVIFMTALADPSDKVRGLQLGAVDYITKPFQQEEVLARVELHLRMRRMTRALEEQNRQLQEEIAQRQEAQLAARRSEAHYRQLIEHSPDIVYAFSSKRGGIYHSPRVYDILGYTPEQLREAPYLWHDSIHPDDLPQVDQAIVAFGRNEAIAVEYRIRDTQGRWHWFYDRSIGRQVDGDEVIIEGLATDITERKLAEQALRASEEYLQAVLDDINDALLVQDVATGQIIDVNRRTCEMYGYTRQEALALNAYDLSAPFEPYTRQHAVKAFARARKAPQIFEWMARHRNGQLFWVEVSVRFATIGGVERYVVAIRDISERKAAEESLRILRQAVEQSPVSIVITDPNGTIEYANPRFEAITGYNLDEARGRNPRLLKSGFTPPEEYEQLWQAISSGGEWSGEFLNRKKNGELYWELASISPIKGSNGDITHFVAIKEDITARKRVEVQIQQLNEELELRVEQRTAELAEANHQLRLLNAELARATRMKDEFLANMSHELRTPLTSILGISEGLLEEVFGSLNDKQKKAIGSVNRSGSHLLELINDVLDLAKIEAGKLDLHIEAVSLKNLCDSSMAFVRQQALKKNLALVAEIEADVEKISADDRRMRQVLINLLSNAVKFTPAGGSIRLKVSQEQPAEGPPAISFAVSDTGIGIAPEDLGKLFHSFTQIDSSLTRQQEGTGLGLALVKRIAELHNGSVGVTSELGRGSCFTVRIPYIPYQLAEGDSVRDYPPALGPARLWEGRKPVILIAEDNDDNLHALMSYIEIMGYQLIIARDGVEAVAQARAHRPDLILMDVQMQKMDGLEATRQIRADPEIGGVPIVVLTALAMAGDRERCLAAGATDYMSKPLKLKQLNALILHLLQSTAGAPGA